MSVQLPALPWPVDALAPVISATTLEVHHGRHHRAYVDKLNALTRDTALAGASLDEIVRVSARRARDEPAMVAVFNNAAQAWNHAFYWRSMRPAGRPSAPSAALAERIRADFGDHARLCDALKQAATGHFGSGWAWLVLDGGALKVVSTANADTPLVHGQAPLLAIDVWEHAYYLDYREQRAAHVAAVVDRLLDWEFASDNFARANAAVTTDS